MNQKRSRKKIGQALGLVAAGLIMMAIACGLCPDGSRILSWPEIRIGTSEGALILIDLNSSYENSRENSEESAVFSEKESPQNSGFHQSPKDSGDSETEQEQR